jgi:HSP20 family protein
LFSEKSWYPTVDVSEGKKDITVKAEIPGVDKEGIDISLDGRFLTIRGEKKHEKEESDEHYHRVESVFGLYKRTIALPADVDESKVDAKYKNGVLKIKLKKAKEAETKKIQIKTVN